MSGTYWYGSKACLGFAVPLLSPMAKMVTL